jgi:putative redox protein
MSFEVNVHGYKMMIDTPADIGGTNEGPGPKSLMLVALAGCTGMDIVSLLRKMKIYYDDLRINVEGNITDEHPKHFDSMHICYFIKGKNIPVEKVKAAIEMSLTKFCGVSYTYKQGLTLTHELIIEE